MASRTLSLRLLYALVAIGALVACLAAVPAFAGSRAMAIYETDAYEMDDTPPDATADMANASSHTFHDTDDVDWFRISAEATYTRFTIEVYHVEGQSLNTRIEVYSVDSSGVATFEDGSDESDIWADAWAPSLVFTAPARGDFFVKIAPDIGSSTGKYQVFWEKGIARRLSGTDRFWTAVQVSRTMWPDAHNPGYRQFGQDSSGPGMVVLANSTMAAEALAGAGLAGRYGGPLLLTYRDTLTAATRAEITRLGMQRYEDGEPFEVVIMGPATSISATAVAEVEALVPVTDVHRITGRTRYDIASLAATYTAPLGILSADNVESQVTDMVTPPVFISNGTATADQVVGGALSAATGGPQLFVSTVGVSSSTSDTLHALAPSRVVVLGGTASVPNTVVNRIRAIVPSADVTRVAGSDRYQMAYNAAVFGKTQLGLPCKSVTLVSGENLVDALSAAPLTAYTGAPVLLTRRLALTPYVKTFMTGHSSRQEPSYLVGGSATVSDSVFRAFQTWYPLSAPL